MSLYRNITWYLKGLKEYTRYTFPCRYDEHLLLHFDVNTFRGGFEEASKSFNTNDLNEDLSDNSCMITGANSGIGLSCAMQLSRLGAKIHMVCRDKGRGELALNELKSQTNDDKCILHILDLSKPNEVYKFGKQFSGSGEKLDILINNAGCMINEFTCTPDNLELNFVSNTLGTYILTETLVEALNRSKDPRVVVVSSGGMLIQKLDLSDINYEKRGAKGFDGTMAYAQNKRQQVVMVSEWALKYPTIRFFSMHPGWADTPAVALSMPTFYDKHKSKLRTSDQGADTAVWLAASKAALLQPNGEFFQDRAVVSQHLFLACTKSSSDDKKNLMKILDNYKDQYSI